MTTQILIVDDSATVRAYLSGVIQDAGLEAVAVRDGLEALDVLGPGHRVHVVLTDLFMPRMDGFALVECIRNSERLRSLPIIMLTHSQAGEDQLINLKAGANDFIRKPFDDTLLMTKVENLAALRKSQLEAEEASWTDALTGIANRRFGEVRLQEEIDRTRRHGQALAVALLDVDHFKRVNDTLGHSVGDDVLIALAEALTQATRSSDILARWGGEEFLMVFPGTTLEEAASILDRFRRRLADTPIPVKAPGVRDLRITMSGGVALFEPNEPVQDLIERADRALYLAKEEGRNRLSIWKAGDLRPTGSTC